jgi:hypothetical protein
MKMKIWAIMPLLSAAPFAAAAAPCPVTTPVRATAPPDQNADPVTGYWHISADQLLWAPATAPGRMPTFIGRYWVRPAGAQLFFTARRLDVPGVPVTSTERTGYPTGFYFGSVDIPTEGCWEMTARTNASSVTFVTEIRYPIEQFAIQPATRATWSKQIGRIIDGATELTVTAVTLEDPQSVTGRLRGVRVDVTDGVVTDQLWREELEPSTMKQMLANWIARRPPMLPLGGYYAISNQTGFSIDRDNPKYLFHGESRPAELAKLLLQAFEELKAVDP